MRSGQTRQVEGLVPVMGVQVQVLSPALTPQGLRSNGLSPFFTRARILLTPWHSHWMHVGVQSGTCPRSHFPFSGSISLHLNALGAVARIRLVFFIQFGRSTLRFAATGIRLETWRVLSTFRGFLRGPSAYRWFASPYWARRSYSDCNSPRCRSGPCRCRPRCRRCNRWRR